MKGPKVVIYPDKAGEYRWRLVGGNGEIQASGEGFETEQHAEESVTSVARNFAQVSLLGETPMVQEQAEKIGGLSALELNPDRVEVITTKAAAEFDEGVV
jgi:uncharacterized protein YegP (UPF0339 family)